MKSENKTPDTQERQVDSNASETAEGKRVLTGEKERISRLADEIAQRAKKRQSHYDKGHNIFTK